MKRITNYGTIAEGTHSEFDRLKTRFDNMVKRTKDFNKSLITVKEVKVGNGFKAIFSRKDNKEVIRTVFLLSDRFGWTLSYQDVK